MAAACATRKAAHWKTYFNAYGPREDAEFRRCLDAIKRNPASFQVPAPMPRRVSRTGPYVELPPKQLWNSHASLVIVPNNLVQQWMQEIGKHTAGPKDPARLKVLTLTSRKEEIPPASELAGYDIVLISQSRLARIYKLEILHGCPLVQVHYKRCIVDEGHKLGTSKIANKSDLLLALDLMSTAARWIVTGTPSNGLYGTDGEQWTNTSPDDQAVPEQAASAAETEKQDLEKIGAIASLYLNARPWSNTPLETEDTTAEWAVYVMQPKHSSRSSGRKGVLRATLNSLLIRHQLSELKTLLPGVNENIVVLEGSYQDKLSLNVFSMMIIFNAVQSERTDMDFFFHPRQKKALLQLLHNLKQASFFGGSFFSPDDIKKSLETAQEFLKEKKVFISDEDEALLKQAMGVAETALNNSLKTFSNRFNEIPIFVRDFLPNDAGAAWSLDDKNANPVCTDAGMVVAVQKLIRSSLGDATKLNSLLNGQLLEEGHKEMADQIISVAQGAQAETRHTRMATVLAGNTRLGGERIPRHLRATVRQTSDLQPPTEQGIPEELKKSELVSTASAKLSYLIDAVVEHQAEEKLIIFYENENVAWYLASMLDVIQVPHLIYAKTLSYERKMQYINTFNHDDKFRVILMDLSQAAVGLDMRAASRIYFINPVLNPQIQAQAIGRARRISQQKPVSVETLVLRGSIEEVIVERQKHMTQLEHWKCKTILDDRPIYNYILNAGIIPLPEEQEDNLAQAVPLKHPQPVFGGGFGREHHPDQDLIMGDIRPESPTDKRQSADKYLNGLKRPRSPEPQDSADSEDATARPTRRSRFTEDDDTTVDTSVIDEWSSTGVAVNGLEQNDLVSQAASTKPARQVRFS